MVKGGKRYSSMSNDGKWYSHAGLPANDTSRRETCTSTGSMLAQIHSSPSQASNTERYPKWRTEQKSRMYPFSAHDNREALQDTICVFADGAGRKKCLDDRRLNSHISLCHPEAVSASGERRGDFTTYQTEYVAKQGVEGTTSHRFPRNHRERSAVAAAARAGECFLWFGRHDSNHPEPLGLLAATNCSAPSVPPRYSYLRRH